MEICNGDNLKWLHPLSEEPLKYTMMFVERGNQYVLTYDRLTTVVGSSAVKETQKITFNVSIPYNIPSYLSENYTPSVPK